MTLDIYYLTIGSNCGRGDVIYVMITKSSITWHMERSE